MNTQSPLVPQGSLDPKNKRRARVKVAVFFVLGVHGVGLLALLLQGCHREREDATLADKNTNAPPAFETTNLPFIADTSVPVVSNTTPALETHIAPPATATEYVVAKGDNFSTIAKKSNITVAALRDANPSVESTKLRIGQKLHIPAATAIKSTPNVASATPATETADKSQVHTVKSGDTLIRLAQVNHTTVRAIRAANNLKSDRITVGQKLKIPGKGSQTASAETASSDVAAVPVAAISR